MYPNCYFFNPTCEPAIANGSPYYTAPARLRQFENDLGYLPMWLAGANDQVLVNGRLDRQFEKELGDLGFKLPEILVLHEAMNDLQWLHQKKGYLRPWGWSPALYHLFKPAMNSFSAPFIQSPVAIWQAEHKRLYSRLSGHQLLRKVLDQPSPQWLADLSVIPETASELEMVNRLIGLHPAAVVKTPWSSSGRGLLNFPNPDTKKKNDEVLSGMLHQQGFVSVEPWLNKLADISYQFEICGGETTYLGRTFFETDPKGRYQRNFLTEERVLSDEITGFLNETHHQVVDMLQRQLGQSDYARYYEGWIGIDAMIYLSADGQMKFHPVVEINGRFTMGALALKLRSYLAPGSHGFLSVYFSRNVNFQQFATRQSAENKLVMADGRIVRGFLPLTPTLAEHLFGAYIMVEEGH